MSPLVVCSPCWCLLELLLPQPTLKVRLARSNSVKVRTSISRPVMLLPFRPIEHPRTVAKLVWHPPIPDRLAIDTHRGGGTDDPNCGHRAEPSPHRCRCHLFVVGCPKKFDEFCWSFRIWIYPELVMVWPYSSSSVLLVLVDCDVEYVSVSESDGFHRYGIREREREQEQEREQGIRRARIAFDLFFFRKIAILSLCDVMWRPQ